MKADELADFAIHTAFLSEGLKKLYKVPKVGLLYS